jgi:Domain of unknown function DUF302
MFKMTSILAAAVLTGIGLTVAASPRAPSEMFWVRKTEKSPEQVVAAVKTYTESNKWVYLAEFKIRGGQITAVKICYPAIASDIFAAGSHVAAMMPCGNIAVYVEQGQTTISMLHPKFMSILAPHERMDKAVREVTPLFEKMLEAVSQ